MVSIAVMEGDSDESKVEEQSFQLHWPECRSHDQPRSLCGHHNHTHGTTWTRYPKAESLFTSAVFKKLQTQIGTARLKGLSVLALSSINYPLHHKDLRSIV